MDKKISFALFTSCLLHLVSPAARIPDTGMEPWREKYRDRDSGGSHVVAMWSFDARNDPGHDDSGNGNNAVKGDYTVLKTGKFGSCLAINTPVIVKDRGELTPDAGFSVDMWIGPVGTSGTKEAVSLLDHMGKGKSGYKISLKTDSLDTYRLSAILGFGAKTLRLDSDAFTVRNNQWRHAAFTYDGHGRCCFFVDGRKVGEYYEDGVSGIAPSGRDLTIGGRSGTADPQAGVLCLDEVRICNRALQYAPLRVEVVSGRKTFVRMEEDALMRLRITNLSDEPVIGVRFAVGWGWAGLGSRFKYTRDVKSVAVDRIEPGGSHDVEVPIDTKLRPDKYFLTVDYAERGNDRKYPLDYFPVVIVPRKLPDQYPVVMWGPSWGAFDVLDKVKEIGFTHAFGIDVDYEKIWKAGEAVPPGTEKQVRETREYLDRALRTGISIIPTAIPTHILDTVARYRRIDRNGNYYEKAHLSVHFPEIKQYCYNTGVSLARAYGDMPAFGGALLHSETRDISYPSYHDLDRQMFREYSGMEIPRGVKGKRGEHYTKIPGFPEDRVISDADSVYTYLKWYWKKGDGWNNVNDELHKGFKTIAKPKSDFWTFHDPAVRVGSVYGSGGLADVISHWTYTYPIPLKIALTTDELLCMADGTAHGQDVMSMTQIIWYRDRVAPSVEHTRKYDPVYEAEWEKALPASGRQYITISPMHLSEAFWTKISRPIKGIMYHGWQSLVPDQYHPSYVFTHDATVQKLKELIETVIKPLGPTLKNIPGIQPDVAYYQSFASQIYAGRGTMGWGGTWLGDAYLVTNYAGLQPRIVYDETLQRDGLKDCKVLFMMDCDVITESVRDVIVDFQKRGGIVVGDRALTPAIKPDILVERYDMSGHGFQDRERLIKLADDLSKSLERAGYDPYVKSSNRDVVTYRRKYHETDYIFLINDSKEYGHYIGQHGLTMENGKPARTILSVSRNDGYVYDLVDHSYLDHVSRENHAVSTEVSLGAGEGRLMMITDRKIDAVRIDGPDQLMPGRLAEYLISVCDDRGEAIDAVIPVAIEIKDSEGRILEMSGYWKAERGILRVRIDIAENDVPGIWRIKVKELASGKTAYLSPRMGEEVIIKPDFKDTEKAGSFQVNG